MPPLRVRSGTRMTCIFFRCTHARRAQQCGRLEARLRLKTLRQGGNVSIGQVEFDAMNAVHREENNGWRKRLAVFDHHGQIINRREFDTADTQALWR